MCNRTRVHIHSVLFTTPSKVVPSFRMQNYPRWGEEKGNPFHGIYAHLDDLDTQGHSGLAEETKSSLNYLDN